MLGQLLLKIWTVHGRHHTQTNHSAPTPQPVQTLNNELLCFFTAEWTAAYLLLLLGWFFAPVYLRCSLTTIPEFLEKRYNKWCRWENGLFLLILLLLQTF